MTVSVSIVIASHLSDVQEEIHMGLAARAVQRCNWVKYLVHKFPDTSVQFDPDNEYADFIEKYPHWAIN